MSTDNELSITHESAPYITSQRWQAACQCNGLISGRWPGYMELSRTYLHFDGLCLIKSRPLCWCCYFNSLCAWCDYIVTRSCYVFKQCQSNWCIFCWVCGERRLIIIMLMLYDWSYVWRVTMFMLRGWGCMWRVTMFQLHGWGYVWRVYKVFTNIIV